MPSIGGSLWETLSLMHAAEWQAQPIANSSNHCNPSVLESRAAKSPPELYQLSLFSGEEAKP
eukprot:1152113-Pelagomonas_calceolata.AAC.2